MVVVGMGLEMLGCFNEVDDYFDYFGGFDCFVC